MCTLFPKSALACISQTPAIIFLGLKAIFMGAQNPFMFIFTCRPMETTHQFRRISDEFEAKTEIQLQGLRRNNVRELVAEILGMDDPELCTSLANFISRVTDGSECIVIFVYIQYLTRISV